MPSVLQRKHLEPDASSRPGYEATSTSSPAWQQHSAAGPTAQRHGHSNPQAAARMARFPPRWQPYETGANGKVTVKANAKLAPAGAKKPKLDVPPPASTWAKPPADSWPPVKK